MLRHIDLFTGICGFTLALQNVSTPIAYCDKSDHSQKVIRKNIQTGVLHDARIYQDLEDILQHKRHVLSQKPHIITAGFPCVDISVANVNGKGLEGDVSGPLFFDMLRLIDALGSSIQCVFLENSSAIMKRGYDILEQEFKNRGFQVEWTILQATDVGAYHRRKRWYCLCWRKHGRFTNLFSPNNVIIPYQTIFDGYDWEKIHTLPRIISRMDENHSRTRKRLMLLGNALVPQCAMLAWNCLWMRMFDSQYVYQKRIKSTHLHMSDGRTSFTKNLWATPTHHTWCIFDRISSPRCHTLLPIQLYYEKNTHVNEGKSKSRQSKEYDCNPTFVETLMGFPLGWTDLP